jgi:hypothetical protein
MRSLGPRRNASAVHDGDEQSQVGQIEAHIIPSDNPNASDE